MKCHEIVRGVRVFLVRMFMRVNKGRSAQGVADQVSEADILELYRNRPAEASSRAAADYRQAREAADRQRVLDYAMMDAAASLASTVESAQSSFDDLTANGNLSKSSSSHCGY